MEQTIEVLLGIPTPKPKYETTATPKRKQEVGSKTNPECRYEPVVRRPSTPEDQPSPVLIGVELELERVTILTDIPKNWETVLDNSLKLQGLEFTCLMSHTRALYNILALYRTIDFITSSRCSTHVHVNILDLTPIQLKTLITLYIIFERYLFEISGRRYNSNYCVPVQHTHKKQLFSNLMSDYGVLYPKYSAIHAFAYDEKKNITLGTLEFRHATASSDPQVLVEWINTVVALKQASLLLDYNELLASLYEMRSTSEYLNLFNLVFKREPLTNNMQKFKRDIEYGITFVKLASPEIT